MTHRREVRVLLHCDYGKCPATTWEDEKEPGWTRDGDKDYCPEHGKKERG